MRSTAQNAELALLLEVTGTPKPGNVDRHREYADLRFEHFLAGAVGARPGLALAAGGERLGSAFERAVAGMARQRGGNTQFGAVLALTPLVAAAGTDVLAPAAVERVVADTTVADAADFYRAFDHVDVAVDDPPADLTRDAVAVADPPAEVTGDDVAGEDLPADPTALDVRRGRDAIPALRARGLTLSDVMELSADRDGVAAEWTTGFPRSFAAADRLRSADGPVPDRTASVFLDLLAEEPDTFVRTRNGRQVAEEVQDRARAARSGDESVEALATELVERDVNPGTTADLTAAALFIALERGLEV